MAILDTSIVHQVKNLAASMIRQNNQRAGMPEIQRLNAGEVKRHAADRQTILLMAGTVWISAGGDDYVLQAGESAQLPRDRHPALVSSVAGQRAIYQIRRAA